MTTVPTPEAPAAKPADTLAEIAPLLKPLLDRVAADPNARVALLHQLLGENACRQVGIYPIPPGFKLSVVIPVYNEERWLREIVRRVREVPIPKEVILVDDCSKDGTRKILEEEISKLPD